MTHETFDAQPVTTTQPRRGWLFPAAITVSLLLVGGYAVRSYLVPTPPAAMPAFPPAKVTVATPLQRRLATYSTFTGQFSAVDRVEIRAQVSGYLTEILFKDGQLVKKGDPLFVIDPRPYDIALQNARAQVETADTSVKLAGQQLSRTTDLMRSEFASRETLDQRTQQRNASNAAMDQAKAMLSSAELNSGWTHINAPLSGRISTHRVSVGNLVAGGQNSGTTTLLTTIVSQNPIYLDFEMGEGDYIAYQRFLHTASSNHPVDRSVEIALTDETGWKHKGTLDFLDNEMDRSSGTIRARATVPNDDLFIAAGQFARLRVPTAGEADTLLVPEAAISTDQSRTMLMTVGADNVVVPKAVKIGEPVGDLRIVKSGISRGDRIIINGLMYARPGSKVAPEPGSITLAADQG